MNLNEHTLAFNVADEDEDSDNLEETFEVNSEFFEDTIVEENKVDENLSTKFMQEHKINLDTLLYSSELLFFDAFDILPVKIEQKTYFDSLMEFYAPPMTFFSVSLNFLTSFICISALYFKFYIQAWCWLRQLFRSIFSIKITHNLPASYYLWDGIEYVCTICPLILLLGPSAVKNWGPRVYATIPRAGLFLAYTCALDVIP